MLSAVAVLLHAAALSGLEWAWPQVERPAPHEAAMRVRVVDAVPGTAPVSSELRPLAMEPVVAATMAPTVTPARAQAPPPGRAKTSAAKAAPAPPPLTIVASPIAELAAASPPESIHEVTQEATHEANGEPIGVVALKSNGAQGRSAASAPAPSTSNSAVASTGDEPIPHYRTQLPPALTLHYDVKRGMLSGDGNLAWKPQGDRYELKLEARVAGLAVLTQVSSGGFDADGVAPERFTDHRLRRSTEAANFQRAAGKVTFSGPSTEYPLQPGTQDRLSWMVQLAAIVAAQPNLRAPGAKVAMFVVGARGEGGVWVFRCVGPEKTETPAGPVDAIKFMRDPRDPNDTTVQVWLDPQRHDLPVRATQRSGPNDDGYELRLLEVLPPG